MPKAVGAPVNLRGKPKSLAHRSLRTPATLARQQMRNAVSTSQSHEPCGAAQMNTMRE